MNEATSRYLEVRGLSGPLLGRKWSVTPDRALTFGRTVQPTPQADAVLIHDLRISSEHCRIECGDDTFRVVDCGSRNGVRINGKLIPRGSSEPLRDGDVISLADVALEIRVAGMGDSRISSTKPFDRTETVGGTKRDPLASTLVLDLLPFPIAMAVRTVRHAMGAVDVIHEILRSFETVLGFQTLIAASEYLAAGKPDAQAHELLKAFCQRPFTLGRWLELHVAVTRALEADSDAVIPELASCGLDEEALRRWRAAAARIVEIRNRLLHSDGVNVGSAATAGPELTDLFSEFVAGVSFWTGYRFISVEPGPWSDRDGTFRYPCRLLLGCTTPFETCALKSASPLPPRVPIVISRDGKRRLSLAPLQALLPAEDKQVHWFWLSELTSARAVFATYPAGFRSTVPCEGWLEAALSESKPSKARATFSGKLLRGAAMEQGQRPFGDLPG